MKRFPAISPLGAGVCLLLTSLVLPLCSLAQSPARSRIVQEINGSGLAVLHGNLNPRARPEFDQGRVNGGMTLKGVSLNFRLSDSQQAALNELLAEQQTPGSPNYHQWITPDEYAERFGMSTDDLNKVTGWLQSEGFTHISVSRSHNRISFTGNAGQIESVFHTEIHNYFVDGETHYAMAVEPSVPQAFAATVLGIRGLNNFRPSPRVKKVRSAELEATPNFTSHVSGNHFIAPGDFATIYNLQSLYNAGLDGTGVTIAVVGQTAISLTDTRAFRSAASLPANDPTLLLVANSGTSTHCTGDEVEADLDVEWSGAVAKGANVVYVYTGVDTGTTCTTTSKSVWDALEDIIVNNRAPVVATSYGYCEAGLGSSNVMTIQQWAQEANAQGQTISAASGDDGAADCEVPTGNTPVKSATQGLAVDVPASIPEVTGVGGTEFTGDAAGAISGSNAGADAPYWAGTTGGVDLLSSALEYIPEMGWNDTAAEVAGTGGLSATGGGASTMFAKPTWQTVTGVPAASHRYVPDVSVSASADHDGYLFCSQDYYTGESPEPTSCSTSGSFRDSGGNLAVVGGTSASSQVFAGVLAIINQGTNSNGLTNVNPTLYSLYVSAPGAFHDIVTGDNIVPCTSGSTGCPTNAPFQYGFSAGAGYDEVTGLGSLNLNTLITSWPGYAPAAGFGVSGSAISISAAGGSGTSTVTVTPTSGFTGTVNLSCALSPASSTAEITCSIPASVDVTSGSATATLTVNTTAAHAVASTSASARPHHGFPWLPASGGLLFAGMVLGDVPSRRRKSAAMAMVVFACIAVWAGCGGGSSSGGGGSTSNVGTPAGGYTIAVTANSGSITRTANITVTVQ